MDLSLVALVGIPLGWHLAIAAAVYYDAGRVGMYRWKWTAVAILVPLFGAFAYLFERSERTVEEENRYDDGTYAFHESVDDHAETDLDEHP